MSIDYNNLEKYVGKHEKCYITYANDMNIRQGAASGGTVSTLLIHLLENKHVQGVFVSRQSVKNGKIVVESFIADTKEDILDCRTSIYTFFPLEKDIDKILSFEGQIVIVLLPCHIKILEVMSKRYPELAHKIKYKVSLFCGGVADNELMYGILRKNHIYINDVKRIYSRKGHWRGKTYIEMQDGQEKMMSYNKNWSTYKNAYFHSTTKCFNCADHFGYEADFSCGDIWLSEMKNQDIKHTAVITKNKIANLILKEMIAKKEVTANEVDLGFIVKGNKRSLIYKFHTAEARKRLGKKHGYNYTKELQFKSKWNHYLAAHIILFNMRLSKNEKAMKTVFKVPSGIMYLYMCAIRFLISF